MSDELNATSNEGQAIMPKPVPGSELCEQTETFATYWKRGAWNEPNREQSLICMEQAVNGWKNLAYDLARQVHYAQRSVPSAVADIELQRVRASYAAAIGHLTAIFELLNPPAVKANGKTYDFQNPNANDTLQRLSDAIRAIPVEMRSPQSSTGAPEFPKAAEIRLALGEMTASEMRTAVAAIRWTFYLFGRPFPPAPQSAIADIAKEKP